MKKIFRSFILCLFILIFVASPLAAAFTAIISVVESSGNSYDMVASNITANIDYMADNGYFGSTTGLDTRVSEGTSAIPHMLVEDRILFANDLNAFQSKNYNFTTDNSLLPAFDIIPGYGGSVNITDDSDIELGDNFTWSTSAYIDTDNGTDKYILDKPGAIAIEVSDTVAGNITATIDKPTTQFRLRFQSTDAAQQAFLYEGAYYDGATWITPTGQVNAGWTNSANAYDGNTGTYANNTVSINAGEWTPYFVFTFPAIGVEQVRFWESGGGAIDVVEISEYYDSTWTILYSGNFPQGVYNTYSAGSVVTATALGVSSGEHELIVNTDNNSLYLGIGVDTNVNDADFPITDNLVFNAPLWHTELNSSPFTSKDTTEFSCTVTGAIFSSTVGRIFDGNDNISVGTVADFTDPYVTGNFTFMVWAELEDHTTISVQRFCGSTASTTEKGWAFGFDNSGGNKLLKFEVMKGVGGTPVVIAFSANNALTDNNMHLFSVRADGTNVYFGVDTTFQTSAQTMGAKIALANASHALELGVTNSVIGLTTYMTGNEGEAQYYNRLLTDAEITAEYNATKWKYDGSTGFFYYNLLGTGVPDNANNYVLLQNNVMPYTDNITFTIGGTQQLWFEPNDIIALSGINGVLPDRQGGDNNGTIIFGSNPAGIVLSLGALISDYSGTIIDTTETPSFVPAGITPQPTATAVKEAALVAHPFYPWVSAFNTTTTVGILFQFQFIYIAGALFAFSGTFTWIRNMFLSGGLFVAVIGLGVTQSVFDWWVLLLVIPVWIGLTIMENRQTI